MKPLLPLTTLLLLSGVLFYLSCKKEYSCENCNQVNTPPIADAGPDYVIVLPVDSIILDGSSSSDADGVISSYAWRKIAGPASFLISEPSLVNPVVKKLTAGLYQVELKITDNDGLSATDTMQIIVTVIDSPVQHAHDNESPDFVVTLPLDSVYLSSHLASVISGSFNWTSLSGPSVVNLNFYGSNALVKNLIPGLYSFRFDVNNALGRSADTINVLVLNNPQDLNTITFNNLKWRLADEYGTGIIDLDIVTPYQPNLFKTWDQLHSTEVYLKIDTTSQWFKVPTEQSGFLYNYDAAKPHIWIARIPPDNTWVGKKSSIKIKLL